ncbi:uncharacterized protein Z518_05297 [Rhinocladiella mackenziei CBS 650.93]|uniref:Rhinocladiella mackenziei CBS 650.93 unplaced genomic scaffold supercont1.4, whole genome shotgun sequence n=1 Tax=Rhinocladiella mackenziei CBS 650.93 TaxID=1442369 RepID=A0A0D2IF39_9EURO|nr:uncharacterized protein Z518_05297 [Rhinocladiella mackenziei CBS 650.93]KIX04429.1 hypothetical protein Z518_05297 [Rhinocladiella mackenziei CBS 650.93]
MSQILRSAQCPVMNDSHHCDPFASIDIFRHPHHCLNRVQGTDKRYNLRRRSTESPSPVTETVLRPGVTPQHDIVQVQNQEQEESATTTVRTEVKFPISENLPGRVSVVDDTSRQSASARAPLLANLGIEISSRSTLCSPQDPSNEEDQPMTSETSSAPAQHKSLVVGRTKPRPEIPPSSTTTMESPTDQTPSTEAKETLDHGIPENLKSNSSTDRPADAPVSGKKKEKAPKQPKPPKAAPPTAPLSPALIDLRVGHILRAIHHPNADSLYVSTIAMGDPEGTEHTEIDEATGKVVRTVCSGLNGLVALEEMQDRKVVVVANLKPVNMRSIKSAAMVLAASPPAEEGADPHATDRVVELVTPPSGAEAGDPVFFEGWPYGEGRGPEKQLNPKKKQWEAIQPGFYTSDDCVVGFDAGKSEVEGDQKGTLVVEGKGKCTVKSLKGAVVR